jgi:Fe2+ or Zn2+ uptake regulation protein
MTETIEDVLRRHGVGPSAQREAVAEYVLRTPDHPTADQVLAQVLPRCPALSRATVYNTLHLLVTRGLLREHTLDGGRVVYDPNVAPHHHFIDERSGAIHDVAWGAVKVSGVGGLADLEVREYQVVMRGRRRAAKRRR